MVEPSVQPFVEPRVEPAAPAAPVAPRSEFEPWSIPYLAVVWTAILCGVIMTMVVVMLS